MIQNKWELREYLRRIDFAMPGFTLLPDQVDDYWDRNPRYASIFIEVRTRDTYDPENPTIITVMHRHAVALPLPEERLIHEVRAAIHRAVTHEADEWLRFDGVMMFNPHANDPR